MGAGGGSTSLRWLALLLPVLVLAAPAPTAFVDRPLPSWQPRAEALLAADPEGALRLADGMVAEAAGDAAAQFEALHARGTLYHRLGRYGEAVLDFEHAIALAETLADRERLATAQRAIGIVFAMSGLYPEALQAFQRSRTLYLELGDLARASGALTNLGNVYGEYGDHQASREHYRLALAMKREHGIERGVASVLNNLSDLEVELGEPARARELLEEAVRMHQAAGEPHQQALARGNLGLVLAQLGDYRAALAELDQSERLAAGGEVRLLAAVHFARAEAYLRMARDAPDDARLHTQRVERALDAIERARAIAADMDDPRRRARIASLASDIRAEAGEPGRALELLREADRHRQELQRRADGARQAVVAARFRDAQQRSEIAELREREARHQGELQRQRLLALALGGGVLLLALLAGLLAFRAAERRRHAAALTVRNVELGDALLEAERLRIESERLAGSNRRLLALVGNDLRGPLVTIRNLAERLLVERRVDGPEHRQVAAIAQAAGELMRLADQIGDSVSGSGELRAVGSGCNAGAVLRAVVQEIDARFVGRERRLRVDGEANAATAIDRRRLERALHELIDAVLQRNPGSTLIVVELRRDPRDGQLAIDIDDPSGAVVQSLDNALGGVGVAVARSLLREAGGELSADRERLPPRLSLRLPLREGATA